MIEKREPSMMEKNQGPNLITSPFLAELALVDVIKCLRKMLCKSTLLMISLLIQCLHFPLPLGPL